MAGLNARMIEIIGWVASHADFFHDALAWHINRGGERYDFGKLQIGPGVV